MVEGEVEGEVEGGRRRWMVNEGRGDGGGKVKLRDRTGRSEVVCKQSTVTS